MKEDKNIITVEAARELVANRLLWPCIRDFLWDFAPQVHPTWFEGAKWLDMPEAVVSSPRVKRYAMDSLGVEPVFHEFPKDDGSRIVLLDGATAELMVKWLGALACADALRRVTSGPAVRELKASFPGIYPEVFGYAAYFGNFDFMHVDAGGPGEIVDAGCSILLLALESVPSPLVSRFKLKFPKDFAAKHIEPRLAAASGGGRRAQDAGEKARASILKLLKLKFPEAYKLCCS